MTPAAAVVVALLVGACVLLAAPPRALALPAPTGTGGRASRASGSGDERALLARLRAPLACLVALGAWALLGGVVGTVAAPVAGAVAWRVLGRAEDPALARRRERLDEELPTGVDLLAACLDAGAAPEAALVTVGRALGGPVEEELLAVHARLELGVDPATVWHDLASHPQLGPLGRTVARAHDSGASVATAVRGLAAELRERAEAEVEARARSIEVSAAAPLGLCLLPAFVLLGIVPLVAGAFASMSVFR
ncbi:type II secretion system F family protein [Nocardioides aurantiacus]|uniref:Type II secretion system (T2SS) protein F n=1 Tax=Nocardioides aurantiacus TaxID=86796 RepID=A0A3N2CP88_9ACTN|nr:type II secretion system F family protein [Nocardioides aurantiacus]ROR89341.1 type II secretion system (T2SS) protein F [Nocardioides aurantiacus]